MMLAALYAPVMPRQRIWFHRDNAVADFEMPKTPAIDVARATLDGIESGDEDIFPDPMARQVYSAWRQDHKAVERQFAAM